MPEPAETLSLFAELSVALAGFSGIVIVLGRRQSGQLSRLELRRLANLFTSALLTLLTSLSALTLLHAGMPEVIVWRAVSAAWTFVFAILTARDWQQVRALSESERTLVRWQLLAAFYASGILVGLRFTGRGLINCR